MATMTDPARELGEIAKRLTKGGDAKGAKYLADAFGVEAWSTSFYKIIACILERADMVETIVRRSSMDDDHKENAVEELDGFKSAFAASSMVSSWNTGGHGHTLMQQHGRAIQFLSPSVRPIVCYPALNEDEIAELIGLIDRYLDELAATEDEPAFVRRAITDGLTQFKFQLKHMNWMGAGYALAAFREVMFVYEATENRYGAGSDLDATAALRGLGAIIAKFKDGIEKAKTWTDAGETVLKYYQVGSAVATPLLLASRIHTGS